MSKHTSGKAASGVCTCANARLNAELLAACRAALERLETIDYRNPPQAQLRVAIAHASGETP